MAAAREKFASQADPEVLAGIGGFGALVEISRKYREPVLVSGTDGVGTKLRLAFQLQRHDTVGIDLVAMSVNDILVQGAEPLFFLDYFACGRLDVEVGTEVIKGIAQGCELAGCALIGGETAEMPSMYGDGEYDLAGFAVGVVDRPKIIDGKSIVPGDVIVGLASSGLHSNGYSLARRVLLEQAKLTVTSRVPELATTIGEALLVPTRIYAKQILALIQAHPIKGIAHITGGGITENLPRVFPSGVRARIYRDRWAVPPICSLISRLGAVEQDEMYRVFNMGIGLILVVPAASADAVIAQAKALGEQGFVIGEMIAGTATDPQVEYVG